ncbi:cysteine desulfurase NifS [Paramaledivibacter caminithermalis]|uniref:Cysteine desulfurase IscS n=1 Tax=Paramaledivibacter caminithermalis (strain DSM 15212 / CIP 107654 / DViRD3) TaxID=1121301 RepID=A0A1M6JTE9_PARC5|nr:cysteine desulfurase NifS [Paramaledivibacter caminithermalis]SHJ50004.1 cysteine desulfurase [Paramaledivibacter caminithermalis DSM 15212]
MKKRIYLDYSATTPMKKEVLDEMMPYFNEKFGNASSIHSFGREAKEALDIARDRIAKAIGAASSEIFFTGGGSEADNWAIKGIAFANKNKGSHIITSKIEHHAVLHVCEYLEKNGFEVTYLDVDEYGMIDLEQLKEAITDKTILISIMFVNNEIGTIQPIKEIAEIAKEKGVYFHTDAVQALGNIPIDVKELGVDLMNFSSHKIYGPKGVGAIYIKKGVKIHPLIHGGAQERKRRAGTENIPGIVGFGKAAELAIENLDAHIAHIQKLRDKLIEGIKNNIDYVRLNGHPTKRHPGNVNFCFEFIEGESLLLSLDMVGIAGSSGSACTSGSLDPSHVLMAIGLTHEIAHGSLRLTIGDFTTEEDIDYVIENLITIVDRLRQMSPLYEKVK